MIDRVRAGRFAVNVLYEDNHLLVVVKPPNLPVQADSSGDDDLLSIMKRYIGNKYQKPGNVYLGLVHRLDRPVGGVMVFARTSKAAARLSAAFAGHEQDKRTRPRAWCGWYPRTPPARSGRSWSRGPWRGGTG